MSRIPMLPRWVLPTPIASIYESESATALEMTAKVYGAMTELIKDYNDFAAEINAEIETLTTANEAEIAEFKKTVEQRLICKFNDLDARYNEIKTDMLRYADVKIASIYEQYLDDQLSELINQKIASGDIEITLVYNPETETLDIKAGGE